MIRSMLSTVSRSAIRHHRHVRVQRGDRVARGLDLRAADVRRPVEHLALEVRQVHDVVVDDAERADARRGEVERGRRPEAPRADQEHLRAEQRLLPRLAHLRQHEVTAVALHLVRGEGLVLDQRELQLLPPADAARHRGHVRVAEIVENLAGEERAEPGEAVERQRRVGVREGFRHLELEEPAADRHGARDGAFAVLVGIAHVDEVDGLALGEAALHVLDRDLGDGALGVGDQIAIGLHGSGLLDFLRCRMRAPARPA